MDSARNRPHRLSRLAGQAVAGPEFWQLRPNPAPTGRKRTRGLTAVRPLPAARGVEKEQLKAMGQEHHPKPPVVVSVVWVVPVTMRTPHKDAFGRPPQNRTNRLLPIVVGRTGSPPYKFKKNRSPDGDTRLWLCPQTPTHSSTPLLLRSHQIRGQRKAESRGSTAGGQEHHPKPPVVASGVRGVP